MKLYEIKLYLEDGSFLWVDLHGTKQTLKQHLIGKTYNGKKCIKIDLYKKEA